MWGGQSVCGGLESVWRVSECVKEFVGACLLRVNVCVACAPRACECVSACVRACVSRVWRVCGGLVHGCACASI